MFEGESTSFSSVGGSPVGSSAVEALTNHVRSLTDDGLVDQSRRIASAIAAAEAELAAVLAEVERRGLHGSWDCPSVERFASWHCQLAPSRAAAITSVGRALTELPVVAASVVSGQLPLAKSAPIIAIAAPDTEAALVELATHATSRRPDGSAPRGGGPNESKRRPLPQGSAPTPITPTATTPTATTLPSVPG